MPPGLYYDEAANGIDAAAIDWRRPPVYFPGNQGREPLHIYAIALAARVVGPGTLAVRLPAAIVGALTILAVAALGREVGGRPVGAIAALLTATSYWHLSLSRLGFRAVWVPLFVAVALALWLRAHRRDDRRAAALSGLAVGLGLYSYIAARVVPALLVAPAIVALGGARRSAALRRCLVAGAVGLVAASPLAVYFARHPELFWQRIENSRSAALPLLDRTINAIGMFFWLGDQQARHNLPERAAFDPLVGALFAIGVVVAARARPRRAAGWTLLAGLPIALLPQILAEGDAHFLRAAAALPIAMTLAAVGAASVMSRIAAGRARIVAAGVLALGLTALTVRDYWLEWAPSRAAFEAFDGAGRDVAGLIRSRSGEPIAAGSALYRGRPIAAYAAPPAATWFDPAHGVALAPGGSLVVVPSDSLPVDIRARLGAPIAVSGRWRDREGNAPATLYRPRVGALDAATRVDARLDGVVAVDGYELPRVARPGDTIRAAVGWHALGPAEPDLTQFAHIVRRGDREELIAGDDAVAVSSQSWRGGEIVLSWFGLRLPESAPVGAYWLSTGFYRAADLRRLAAAAADGQPIGDRLLLGPIKLWRPELAQAPPTNPVAVFDEGLILAAIELPPTAAPGTIAPIALRWWAAGPTSAPYTVFVHLLDGENRQRAGRDGPPASGQNPSHLWQAGESVSDDVRLELPRDLPAATYAVEVGLYEPATGRRVRLVRADERLGDAAIVGRLRVP